jgi:hypothetical protein
MPPSPPSAATSPSFSDVQGDGQEEGEYEVTYFPLEMKVMDDEGYGR